jgi:hypothetical protein
MKVRDNIGKAGDHQLAGAVDAAGAADAWMSGERADVADDLENCVYGGARVVGADIFLDRIEVAVSGVRPL